MENDRVLIFDTTMRDGEQAGHKMSPETKVAIARWLERLNVDVIEAGFPISSDGDMEGVRKVSEVMRGPIVCALARARPIFKDIEVAARSLEHAKKPRIHVFAPTSEIHIANKLQSTEEEVLGWVASEVRRARSYVDDVQFSPEDATRTDLDYLIEVIRVAVQAGATTINIPDTNGYIQPEEFKEIIEEIFWKVPEIPVLSVHCHDDLGQSVANSLVGVTIGVGQIEGCFIGIGERAGNVPLEEVIMALHTRRDFYKAVTGINLKELVPFARFLSKEIAYPIPGHKAIIGENAFRHGAGIHVDGVRKDRNTYEIMKPEDIGWSGKAPTFTSHLGHSGLQFNLERLGYTDPEITDAIHDEFKKLANIKGRLTEEDLHMLAQEYLAHKEAEQQNLFIFEKDGVSYTSDKDGNVGVVWIRRGDVVQIGSAKGDGSVDALCNAVKEALRAHGENVLEHELVRFDFIQGAGGSEAIGSVTAKVKLDDRIGFGRSSSTDLVRAYASAYLDALNHMLLVPVSEEKETLRKVYE